MAGISQPGPSRLSTRVLKNNFKKETKEYAIIPPDGGWGWVVVASAFYCNAVIDGILFTFGLYLEGIAKQYHADKASVALIGSLIYGIHFITGPLSSALMKSFGVRPMVAVGSAMTAFAMFSASFQPPLWAFTIIMGIFSGFGMGFVYLPSITITAMYFSRYRIFAVGIVVCGTGAGTIIFELAGYHMLKTMTWIQVHMVLGASALLMAVAGLAFRPLQPVLIVTEPHISQRHFQSQASLHSIWDDNEDDQQIVFLPKKMNDSLISAMDKTGLALETFLQDMQTSKSFFKNGLEMFCGRLFPCFRKPPTMLLMSPLMKKELLMDEGGRKFSCFQYSDEVKLTRWLKIKQSFTNMNWKILKNGTFAIYNICGCITSTAIIMVFTFENLRSLSYGFTADTAATQVMALGASNMLWRIFLGLVTLFPQVDYHALNVVGMCLAGVALIASTFTTSIYFYYIYCVILGLGMGCYAVFRPVLLLEIVGMDQLPTATGISFLFLGPLAIVGPPFAGWIFYMTKGYGAVYWLAGSLFIASGLMQILIRKPQKLRREELDRLSTSM